MNSMRSLPLRAAGLKSLTAAVALLAGVPGAAAAMDATSDPAPATDDPSEDTILVEGIRDKAQVIDDYVRALTVVRAGDPLPRYEEGSYCPGVVGLSPERNADLEARMYKVAEAAGVKPAKLPCRTSALVLFVDDKESFLKAFRKAHPVYFSDPDTKLWSPPREDGPAMAWHLTQRLDYAGNPGRASGGVKIFESNFGGSRITQMTKPVIAMSVVIIERRGLVGLTPVQIADYALMRTLTDQSPAGLKGSAANTVLTAIDAATGDAVPESLTEWDLAYVRGRYSTPPFRNGYGQGAAINAEVKRKVAAREDGNEDEEAN